VNLRDVSRETASMRRATRWLAELRADAGVSGRTLTGPTVRLLEHMTTCADCELREHNDPELCDDAEDILDGEPS